MALDRRSLAVIALAAIGALVLSLLAGYFFTEGSAKPRIVTLGETGPGVQQERKTAPVTGDQAQASQAQGNQSVAKAATVTRLLLPQEPATQDGELSFSGEGFMPGEAVTVAVSKDTTGATTQIGEFKADAQGNLQGVSVQLPEWVLSGAHVIQASGRQSERTAQDTLYVRAKKAWIDLKDYAVRQAGKLGLIAGGFAPQEEVALYLAPGSDRPGTLPAEPLATVKADRAGNTSWNDFQVPLVNPGSYAIVLHGVQSGTEVVRTVQIQPLIALLQLSPWSGPPGTKISVTGQGYEPGEKVQVLFEGSSQPAATLTADVYGNVASTDPIEVPQRLGGGSVGVTLLGVQSGAKDTQRFSVIGGAGSHAWGQLSSYAGTPGSTVYFSGGGFGSNEKVSVHQGDRNGPVVATGQSGADGSLSEVGPVAIPADAGQDINYTISGESSGAEASVQYKVLQQDTPQPQVTPEPQATPVP